MALRLDYSLWYDLGEELGIEDYKLATIKYDNAQKPNHSEYCTISMFSLWIKTDDEATYKKLAKALSAVGMRDIAITICRKHGMFRCTCTFNTNCPVYVI